MNRIFKSLAIILVMSFGASSALAATVSPSKKYVVRKVKAGKFDAVRTNTAIDIEYTVGPQDIEIYAPENLMPYIRVSIGDSEIRVGYSENMNISGNHKTVVRVSSPDVRKFTAASAGDIIINSNILKRGKVVELLALSAGDIKAKDIEAEEVKIRTNSAGDIKAGAIKVENVTFIANSAGDIKSGNIEAVNNAKFIANSSGDIAVSEVIAGKSLETYANSSGDIKIGTVSAPTVSFASNSSGDVKVSDIKTNSVNATANSAGDVTLSGICSDATLKSGSSGNMNASSLKAVSVTAVAGSSGNVSCWALKSLSAYRKSSGKIRYKGEPTEIVIEDKRKDGVIAM